MKLIFLDLETGGLLPTDPILQMSWIIRVDGQEYKNDVFVSAKLSDCDPVALQVTGIDPEDPKAISPKYALQVFIKDLERFINVDDPLDKFYLVGYNCHGFDCKFLRAMFVENFYTYNKYFWQPPTDVMLIAAGFCTGQRHIVGDFKLVTVARSLGIEVEEDKLHDAMYDTELTMKMFDVLAKELL